MKPRKTTTSLLDRSYRLKPGHDFVKERCDGMFNFLRPFVELKALSDATLKKVAEIFATQFRQVWFDFNWYSGSHKNFARLTGEDFGVKDKDLQKFHQLFSMRIKEPTPFKPEDWQLAKKIVEELIYMRSAAKSVAENKTFPKVKVQKLTDTPGFTNVLKAIANVIEIQIGKTKRSDSRPKPPGHKEELFKLTSTLLKIISNNLPLHHMTLTPHQIKVRINKS